MQRDAHFHVGQLIRHKLFDYRGVVFDVDAEFSGTEEWYEKMARSKPPKNKPWYHVLVDKGEHTTYVAERNLLTDDNKTPIRHPLVDQVFDSFEHGQYITRQPLN